MNTCQSLKRSIVFALCLLVGGSVLAQVPSTIKPAGFSIPIGHFWTNLFWTNLNLLAKPGELLWSLAASNRTYSSPAVGADGTIYFGSGYELFALDGKTGSVKWGFEVGAPVYSSPAIGPDGIVFISSGIFESDPILNGYLCAVDSATGAEIWNAPLGPAGSTLSSPALDAFGRIFLAKLQSVHAFDSKTGHELWSQPIQRSMHQPVVGSEGIVYFEGLEDDWSTNSVFHLYALNSATGGILWKYPLGSSMYSFSSPSLGPEGQVYVTTTGSEQEFGRVYALNGVTGQKLWEFRAGQYVMSTPVVGANGWIYIGSATKTLYALDGLNGAKKWEYPTKSMISTSAAVGADGTVYVGDKGALYALNGTTGTLLWTYTNNGVSTAITITTNGTLLFGYDKKLHAVKANSPLGAAPSAWPMFGQNCFHTGRGWSAPCSLRLNRCGSPPGVDGLALQGAAGRKYQIDTASSLTVPVQWSSLILTNRFGSAPLPSPPPGQQRFFQIQVLDH
jgi:outer membrane protein assembly factor BamB